MTRITPEELEAAARTLLRLRGFVFQVKEAAARSENHLLPDDYLPEATRIAEQLHWGAVALHREAEAQRNA